LLTKDASERNIDFDGCVRFDAGQNVRIDIERHSCACVTKAIGDNLWA